ncbi:cell division protein FtsL [Amorphus orientalis]|uniref:Cell division protein FtsL n=1 Tax=Amorphus orientalis TaxID=649198 RepID=A0AAE3VNG3_9HYPH|nr:hypothetical protein [Amorphus orientalis]MDQ0315308.1 hypothetical protein [Amorphus orientalis]
MYRIVLIVLFAAVLVTASAVFAVKKDAERAAGRAHLLSQQIAEEKAKIAELRAAWSTADDPGRLQKLVDQNEDILGLAPIEPGQIGTFDDIPRQPVIQPDADAATDTDTGHGRQEG